MAKRKPEALALVIALGGAALVVIVFLIDLVLAHNRDLEEGEHRLQHFSLMMAEHSARTFEAIDVLLREISTDLSRNRRDWEKWEPSKGWEYVAQRQSRSMPQLRDLIIFDRNGDQRFISTRFPSPKVNIQDRPYFASLAKGTELTTFGPYISRNSGQFTYTVARRLVGDNGQFTGLAIGTIEPSFLQDFSWPNRLSDDFEAVLANSQGEIIASCRPSDLSRQSPILGAKLVDVLFQGQLRGLVPDKGLASGNGFLILTTVVPGFPDLRIVSAIPQRILLANWRTRLIELTTLGLLVGIVMLIGALLIRRQVREMSAITAELQASRDHLEERVQTATEELAGRKDAAERANTAKSRFLAAASHDLRQPLHALALFAADLQRQVRSGNHQDLPRLAEQIGVSTTTLGQLLDSLLDISRLDVAGIKPDIRPFALAPLFERLSASFRRPALDKNLRLRIRPNPYWTETDPMMLERMIGNLISNAIRYTQPGGRILVAARKRHGQLEIEVRDSGIGIAPQHQAAIFGEFYQVGNAAREHNKGLGLGLSIIERLSRALDIPVDLRSRIGEGSTFRLRLPIRQAVQLTAQDQPPTLTQGRVHCIGSSAEMRECRDLIERWDYEVSAIEHASSGPLPLGMVLIADAAEALAVNADWGPEMPLIILGGSANADFPAHVHALPLPLRPAKLRALVAQLQKTCSKSMP